MFDFLFVSVDSFQTLLSSEASLPPSQMYFANGPKFAPSKSMTPLLLYKSILKQEEKAFPVAAFEATVGKGRVVVFGPHPESSVGWQKALIEIMK